ncbi:phage tail tape measure protein [Psychrobacter sp. I-STPA10]|uniref:phage tail tape measure protein n=1 Tax=Psychrobacter sp. I-STPA10 TaxID=2585769 RepID=UPI001E4F0AE8|nr:phage tail tape measure protein [Psychrobacter sp. I-STPA10]
MSNANLKLALEIALQTKNLTDLDLLTDELKAAGIDVANLSEKGEHLNDTFNAISQKQGLIKMFREQKQAVVDAANAWQSAQEQTKTLAQEWQAAKTKAEALKTVMEAQGAATKEQKAEYRDAVKEVERLAKAHEQSAKQAASLKQTHTSLNISLNDTRQAMSDLGLSTTDLASQEQFLQEQTQAAQEALSELTAEAENLNEIAQAKILLGIETDDVALQQIEEITTAYETLRDSGQLTGSELARASELATAQIEELEASLSDASDETTDFATELGKVTAAAGGLAVVTSAAMDFEAAMAGVKKTVDGTPEQIQTLSGDIKQLAIDLGLSSEAVADIAAQGGQLGIPIEELGKFTEMAGKMSVAFGISADEAAESAAQLANVFGISMQSVEALGDAINTLGNNTAAKEPDIINAMVRIGGTAKQFGLAEEQAASLAAAFIALGKPPEVAATAINGLLTKLQTAQVQGAGFQESLDNIGLSANQLADDINANPQEALINFLQTLSKLDDQQRSITTFKLFGQEYADDVNLLVGSLDTYNQTLDLTQDKSATAGAMQSEFEAQMSTSAAATARAEQSLIVLAQTLGQHLLPIVSATASGVASVVEAVNGFAESYPMITKLVVLIASARVATVAFNSAMALAGTVGLTAGANIATGMTTARASILSTTTAANGLAGKMSGLSTLFAAAASWTIGTAIGDSLYENSSAVRAFGDELARGLAYLDAMVTDRTFDDVRNNFETSAESAQRLAEAQKLAVKTSDELAAAETEAANAARQQADENRQLVNDIIATEATVKILNRELINLAANGQKNTQEYNQLATELNETTNRLEAMHLEAKQNNLGELLKSDLDKASDAFETLGLDAQEFATGMNSEVTKSLEAFSVIAELAEGDTTKLARAYNAAKESAGQNAQTQAGLEQALLAATNGNKELADSVKRTALEQQAAKSATDAQSQALQTLGINMDAVNQKMSTDGFKMVQTLKAGVAAIKEQATSADTLKTALTSALDTSLAAAKTQADFKAIKQILQEAGVVGQVTAEQMRQIDAGLRGGAKAADEAKQALDAMSNAANNVKPPIDAAKNSMQQLGNEAGNTGKKMVAAAQEGTREFEKLKKTVDDQHRVLNDRGTVLKMVSYDANSAYKKLLSDLKLQESELAHAEINLLKTTASNAANSKKHLIDPIRNGMTNAFAVDEIFEDFIKANKNRQWGKKAKQEYQPPPSPTRQQPSQNIQISATPNIANHITVSDIVNALDARIVQQIKDIGAQEFMQKLKKELARKAR